MCASSPTASVCSLTQPGMSGSSCRAARRARTAATRRAVGSIDVGGVVRLRIESHHLSSLPPGAACAARTAGRCRRVVSSSADVGTPIACPTRAGAAHGRRARRRTERRARVGPTWTVSSRLDVSRSADSRWEEPSRRTATARRTAHDAARAGGARARADSATSPNRSARRGRERGGGRRLAVTLAGARAHEKLVTNGDTSGLRPSGSSGADRSASTEPSSRASRALATAVDSPASCPRGADGLGGHPREQRDERQHARGRDAQQTHHEDALQTSSSRSRPEVAAHDSSYPADQRKVPARPCFRGSDALPSARAPRATFAATQRSRFS